MVIMVWINNIRRSQVVDAVDKADDQTNWHHRYRSSQGILNIKNLTMIDFSL